jgi:hypothetical protein
MQRSAQPRENSARWPTLSLPLLWVPHPSPFLWRRVGNQDRSGAKHDMLSLPGYRLPACLSASCGNLVNR